MPRGPTGSSTCATVVSSTKPLPCHSAGHDMSARLRATLRLSWRLVRRAPARSMLVMLLVAVPVCAGVFVTTMIRTAQLSPAEAVTRYLGQADAIALVSPYPALDADFAAVGMGPKLSGDQVKRLEASQRTRDRSAVDVPALLPAGAHAIRVGWERGVSVASG